MEKMRGSRDCSYDRNMVMQISFCLVSNNETDARPIYCVENNANRAFLLLFRLQNYSALRDEFNENSILGCNFVCINFPSHPIVFCSAVHKIRVQYYSRVNFVT